MTKRSHSSKPRQPRKKSQKRNTGETKSKTTGPRKPSGYLIFCAEQRSKRKAELEQMAPKEIMKHLGAEWRKLSAQQQEQYKSKAPHASGNKSESMSSKSQSHKSASHQQTDEKSASRTDHSGKQQSMTKKKGEQSASRKATHHQEDHQSETGSES